ncbi:hypothetical protein ACJJIG_17795 [Microbulbifer sp. SSSA007]
MKPNLVTGTYGKNLCLVVFGNSRLSSTNQASKTRLSGLIIK